jgi:bifunctional enzyme CysN/CysC
MTCGSVDDGKSTLIGRLLYESMQVFEDQLASLREDSNRFGTQGHALDLALLVDGLQAEREQAITIDVAYRFFSTPTRKFIVADTPGHEQYTRNMATGASTAQLAVILVDARKGVLTQTRRHSRIVSMLGVKHVVLAVNKMDTVHWDRSVFERITDDYRAFAGDLQFLSVAPIPLSALTGANITSRADEMPWYVGPPLLAYLSGIEVANGFDEQPHGSMPVQYVNRPSPDFRGFCGRIAQGTLSVGERVRVVPGGLESRIKSIVQGFGTAEIASSGDAVTLTLEDEVDISRGDVICAAAGALQATDQFEAKLLWMAEHALVPGRPYLLKIHAKEVGRRCPRSNTAST